VIVNLVEKHLPGVRRVLTDIELPARGLTCQGILCLEFHALHEIRFTTRLYSESNGDGQHPGCLSQPKHSAKFLDFRSAELPVRSARQKEKELCCLLQLFRCRHRRIQIRA